MAARSSAVTLLLAACGGACASEEIDVAEPQEVLVGRALDPAEETVVAIVTKGDEIVFYACGGEDTVADNTHWFNGTIGDDGKFAIEGGGWSVEGARAGDKASGSLRTASGEELLWEGSLSDGSTAAGLYVVVDAGCTTGVVVLDEGGSYDEPFVQGSWCDGDGTRLQVTPVYPEAVSHDGFEVSVDLGDTTRRLFVRPISL